MRLPLVKRERAVRDRQPVRRRVQTDATGHDMLRILVVDATSCAAMPGGMRMIGREGVSRTTRCRAPDGADFCPSIRPEIGCRVMTVMNWAPGCAKLRPRRHRLMR